MLQDRSPRRADSARSTLDFSGLPRYRSSHARCHNSTRKRSRQVLGLERRAGGGLARGRDFASGCEFQKLFRAELAGIADSPNMQVVIVADGVHSPARWLLTPHARKAAEKIPSGYSVHRSAISAEKLKADKRCSRMLRARTVSLRSRLTLFFCADLLDGTIRTWLGPDAHACTYPLDNGNGLAFVSTFLLCDLHRRPLTHLVSPEMQTYTHRDDGSLASLDWRDKKPIAGMLKELTGWDPVLLAALSHVPSSLHWTIVDEKPEEEWISAGGRVSYFFPSRVQVRRILIYRYLSSPKDLLRRRLCPPHDGSFCNRSVDTSDLADSVPTRSRQPSKAARKRSKTQQRSFFAWLSPVDVPMACR